jgi:TM2 domain-containing membrane protein YozV|nr:MAG TPA: hypothetical protein [Caudoviricetes sp.]
MIYNNLILASWLICVVLSLHQIYQHCKGNFKYYKVSNRYINFIIMMIIMLVMWFVLINMKYDELMEVCNVKC